MTTTEAGSGHPLSPDTALIDALGGTVSTAALCEVSPQAVTQWRRKGIPRARRKYLQLLRPEVFGSEQPASELSGAQPGEARNAA